METVLLNPHPKSQGEPSSSIHSDPTAVTPALFWLLGLLFLPAISSTLLFGWHHEQVLNIFWILLFAHFISFRYRYPRVEWKTFLPTTSISRQWGTILLLLTTGTASVFFQEPLLGIAGVAIWIYHILQRYFPLPHTRALTFGWLVFLASPLFYSWLSFPLQGLSADAAQDLLSMFGVPGRVLHDLRGEGHRILLQVGMRVYHVAAECNGFSLVFCSAITAGWLSLTQSFRLPGVALAICLSLPFAFTMNVLRIATISVLTQSSLKHYDLIHEVVGSLAFWLGLLAIYYALRPVAKVKKAA